MRYGSTQCGTGVDRSHDHSHQQRMALAGGCVLQRGNGRVEWGCIEFSQSNDQHQWDYAQHLMSRTPASLNPHRVFCRRCTPTRRRFGRDQPVARQAARVAFALNESSLLQS